MSRKSAFVTHDLAKQMSQRLHSMNAYGQSRHADKLNNVDTSQKIYAQKTLQNYEVSSRLFADWCKENHPDATLKTAKELVPEYLQHCIDKGLSAPTLKTYRAALGKVFNIKETDKLYKELPKISRSEFTRSRSENTHFNREAHPNIVNLALATGGRRDDLKHLQKDNLYNRDFLVQHKDSFSKLEQNLIDQSLKHFPNNEYFVKFEDSKGGRSRFSPVDSRHQNEVLDMFRGRPTDKVLTETIPKSADIHAIRAEYANSLLEQLSRPIESIPYDRVNHGSGHRYQSGVYSCRGDMKGKKFDRDALKGVAVALGHGNDRVEIFVNNYFR